MNLDVNAWLRGIAGTVVLVSVGLSVVHDPRWLWFTAFVGVNLLQSSLSGWCPMMAVLRKAGVREGRC